MIITCPGCATRYEVPEGAFDVHGRRVRCQACAFDWYAVPDDADSGWNSGRDLRETGKDRFADIDADAGLELDQDLAEGLDGTGADADADMDLAGHLAEAERLERNLAAAGHGPAEDDGQATDVSSGWRRAGFRPVSPRRPRLPAGPVAVVASLALVFGALYEYRGAVVRAVPQADALYELAGLEVNVRGMTFENVVVGREFENGLPVLAVRGEIVNITGRPLEVPRLRFGLRDRTSQEIYHWTMAVPGDRLAAEERVSFMTRLAAPPADAHDVEVRFFDVGTRRADS